MRAVCLASAMPAAVGIGSPWQPYTDSVCSRKTLIYLILTLNHIYPDYDFSQLRAHHFRKEASIAVAEQAIDSHLLEVSRVSVSWVPPRPISYTVARSCTHMCMPDKGI